jgi:pyrimidine-nucleoside phosphorylase
MLLYDLIKRKRDGIELPEGEVGEVIHAYVRGEIPDYQMAALLMAIFFRGFSTAELAAWAGAMVHSGEVIEFSGKGPYLDKHSTGGVGDKISLPLAPILACLGIRVPMISGRGLGHTGGTLDKLESIPGFRTDLSIDEFKRVVEEVGCSIIGQTSTLAPADKRLYALRDVTATVDSIPLIASSILSKKRASGISGLLMDVKTGSGAFMKSLPDARALAVTLVDLGRALGLSVRAFITDMSQPLGVWAGNAVEIFETLEVLRGRGPADTTGLVEGFAVEMAVMGGVCPDAESALASVRKCVSSGAALERFGRMVGAQGGNPRIVDDPGLLPTARQKRSLDADRSGYVAAVDCEVAGRSVVVLGGGRRRIEDKVDFAVGLEVHHRVGDRVEAGEPLVTVHYDDGTHLDEALALLRRAYVLGEEPCAGPALIHEVL